MTTITERLAELGYVTTDCYKCGTSVMHHAKQKDLAVLTGSLSRTCCRDNVYELYRETFSEPTLVQRKQYSTDDPRNIQTHFGMISEEAGNKKGALAFYIHGQQPDLARNVALRLTDQEFWEVIDTIATKRTAEYKYKVNREFKLKHGTPYSFSDEDSKAIFRLQVYQCAQDAGLEAMFFKRFGKE